MANLSFCVFAAIKHDSVSFTCTDGKVCLSTRLIRVLLSRSNSVMDWEGRMGEEGREGGGLNLDYV